MEELCHFFQQLTVFDYTDDAAFEELSQAFHQLTLADNANLAADTAYEASLDLLLWWRNPQFCLDPRDSPRRQDPNERSATFLGLPLEVREIIYTFVFDDLPVSVTVENDTPTNKLIPLPAVCFTSTQVWYGAAPTYLRRTDIIFLNEELSWSATTRHNAVAGWLAKFPENAGFRAIRSLSYIGDGIIKYAEGDNNLYPDSFASHCPGLRHLTLTIDEYALRMSGGDTSSDADSDSDNDENDTPEDSEESFESRLKAVKEIYEEGQWEGLFALTSLRSLKLILKASAIGTRSITDYSVERLWASFLTMIRAGFDWRGGQIEIIVEYVEEDADLYE